MTEHEKALETMAQEVLANLVNDTIDYDDLWELYPDIGENDWTSICHLLMKLTPYPADSASAYAFLEARADD